MTLRGIVLLLAYLAAGCSQDSYTPGDNYAECILINIRNAHNRGAAGLVKRACADIHKPSAGP